MFYVSGSQPFGASLPLGFNPFNPLPPHRDFVRYDHDWPNWLKSSLRMHGIMSSLRSYFFTYFLREIFFRIVPLTITFEKFHSWISSINPWRWVTQGWEPLYLRASQANFLSWCAVCIIKLLFLWTEKKMPFPHSETGPNVCRWCDENRIFIILSRK